MLDPYNSPWVGRQAQEAQGNAEPTPASPAAPNIANEWTNFLNDPRGQAMMMQAGVSLMQPAGFAQSPMGHLGQAIGDVGGMLSRNDQEDRLNEALGLKAAEVDRKTASDTGRNTAASTRAGAAVQNAETRRRAQESGVGLQGQMLRKEIHDSATARQLSVQISKGMEVYPNDPKYARFKGMSVDQIYETLKGGAGAQLPTNAKPTSGGRKPPEVGEELDGYRFRGGAANDPNNWEPV